MSSYVALIVCCFNFFLDVNECLTDKANECDSNAVCTNTEGSYVCRCKSGFSGDGDNCSGMFPPLHNVYDAFLLRI